MCIRDNGIYKCNYKWGIFYDVGGEVGQETEEREERQAASKS